MTQSTPQPAVSPAPEARRKWLRAWSRDFLVSVALATFVILFLYQPVRVEGTSMLPELRDADRVFINKLAYRFGAVQRGDVVVFHYPDDPSLSYIKRVIAGPGDMLRIDRGAVYVNGALLAENYVPARFRDDRSLDALQIPANEYFMMGDHRSISQDSRDFGPVERKFIYGKAVFVYWPAPELGIVR